MLSSLPLLCSPSAGLFLTSRAIGAARTTHLRLGLLDPYEEQLSKVYEGLEASNDPSLPSHTQIELDEQGEPVLARFTYVDENTCIGCKNCALVARNTFLIEETLGKARVFSQGGDSDELIAEAIDSCPVNCIHYVSHEDLVTLETEREQRAEQVTINNYGDFKRAWVGGTFAPAETKATYYDNPKLGARCTNCPSRGCKECPMFGVGENPVYLQRLAEREAKRQKSGQAAEEQALKERSAIVDQLVSAEYAVAQEVAVYDAAVASSTRPRANSEAPTTEAEPSTERELGWVGGPVDNAAQASGGKAGALADFSAMDLIFADEFGEELEGVADTLAGLDMAAEKLFSEEYGGISDEDDGRGEK